MQQEILPVSFSQQRLWLMDQLEPGSSAYNLPFAVRLDGRLSHQALEKALQAVVQRHEALRTTFTAVDGEPVQVIAAAAPAFDIPVTTVEDFPVEERLQKALALARASTQQPFDLQKGPLFRVLLIRMSEDQHLLVMPVHQIVADRWSFGILIRDLASYYDSVSAGHSPDVSSAAIQYGDYARWQREWMTGDSLRAEMEFWKKVLRHAPSVLHLPGDAPRPVAQTHRGSTLAFTIDSALTTELTRLSNEQGVTLSITLLSALKVLLWRYTGTDDILVGTPVTGRDRAELQNMVGSLANTVVIRSDLQENPTFSELLRRVAATSADAMAHQNVPFEKIVQELQPERSFSHAPIFQVMLAVQGGHSRSAAASQLRFEQVDFDSGIAQYDLEFDVRETDVLECLLTYNTDIFRHDRMERLIGHFRNLLAGIVATPGAHASELPLLSNAERQTIVDDWNQTDAPFPSDVCIHQMFEAQVDRTPDAVALIADERELTYRYVDEEANRLAYHLIGLGAVGGARIGVCVERSVEAIIALLAVMKTGASYVPIDPAYPEQRIAFMLSDSKASILITQHGLRSRLPEYAGAVVHIDRDHETIRDQAATRPNVAVSSSDVAYTIYTSGSTGTPKGVMGSHRAALNRFAWMWNRYPFSAGEVLCQKTSLSFVDSIWEMFGGLLQGTPTYVVPDDAVRDPEVMVRALDLNRVTRLVVVPSFVRAMLENIPDLSNRLPHLRFWVTSGEELSFDLYQRFRAAMPNARLLNLYGSSEVAADVTYFDTSEKEPAGFVPIGRPIANTRAYILDRFMNPVPVGVAGELYIGGAGLALGYLDREDLTNERFIADPFVPNGRLFKTGDLARYAADGEIEYLGRTDTQVKVRGIRIELGEIESVLTSHEAVRQAVVTVDQSGENRMVAYCVPEPGHAVDVGQLRRFVRSRVPEHMMPSGILLLDSLPLTPNGKIDRRNLPPVPKTTDPEHAYVAPRNKTEEKVAGIWSEVLRLDPVGVEDNFFEIGGDSLLAVKVIARVRKEFGVEVAMRTLFEEPTIAGFGRTIEKALQSGGIKRVPQIKRRAERQSKAELLAKLNEMSEEDIEALLQSAAEKRSRPTNA